VKVAGTRWAVEECFQAGKNKAGLDHYQVRLYRAWYRHVTLAMLAHASLAVTARPAAPPRRWGPRGPHERPCRTWVGDGWPALRFRSQTR